MSKTEEQIRHHKVDEGGPLEQAAHRADTEFKVEIRDNTQGGYIYWDYRGDPNNPGRVSGKRQPNGKPVMRQLYLREFDQQRHKLHSHDEKLDEILVERACIKMFREKQEHEPIEATKKLMKKGPNEIKKALENHAARYNGVTGDLKELAREMKFLAEQIIKLQSEKK